MLTYSRTSFDQADRHIADNLERWHRSQGVNRSYEAQQVIEWSAVRRDLLSEAIDAALLEDTQHSTTAPQIAAQPVSLVKSAPATYCTGSALPTRAHPTSYFTSTLRRNNLYLFAIACSKSV